MMNTTDKIDSLTAEMKKKSNCLFIYLRGHNKASVKGHRNSGLLIYMDPNCKQTTIITLKKVMARQTGMQCLH